MTLPAKDPTVWHVTLFRWNGSWRPERKSRRRPCPNRFNLMEVDDCLQVSPVHGKYIHLQKSEETFDLQSGGGLID
ncbi:hypothetical protein P4S72_25030 [Vibrio sp. PP-XX7]